MNKLSLTFNTTFGVLFPEKKQNIWLMDKRGRVSLAMRDERCGSGFRTICGYCIEFPVAWCYADDIKTAIQDICHKIEDIQAIPAYKTKDGTIHTTVERLTVYQTSDGRRFYSLESAKEHKKALAAAEEERKKALELTKMVTDALENKDKLQTPEQVVAWLNENKSIIKDFLS